MWSETHKDRGRESLERWRFASTAESLEVAANFHPKSAFTMKIGRSLGKIDSESLDSTKTQWRCAGSVQLHDNEE
jgi:hypothetical protein